MTDQTDLQREMNRQLEQKKILEQAKAYAFDYMDRVSECPRFPPAKASAR